MGDENMKRCILILLTVLSLFLLLSCKEEIPSVDVTEPDTVSQAEDADISLPEWKTAYLDFIKTREREYEFDHLYSLVNVDGDGIPELYAMGTCEAEGDLVCSYKNGSLISQPLLRTCGGRYIENSGMIVNRNGHMGYYYDNVYKLDENGFSQILDATHTERYIPLGNDEIEIIEEYLIDGKAVTKEEYYAVVNDTVDPSQTVSFSESAVSYDVIKQLIADCK